MRTKYYLGCYIAAITLTALSAFGADAASLAVKKDGSVYIEEKKVSFEELTALATAEAKKDKDVSFRIIADGGVSAKALSDVMDTCRKAGVTHFTIKEANQALVPTPMSVTSPAEQARVPDTGASHLSSEVIRR